ncbi:hypothetical protein SAMN06298215_1805 [Bacteroidales bacterium WCE2008]|nr:hypothetical protein SAMN06298215_1805 [Bacteroidales bacterium WCE2008]
MKKSVIIQIVVLALLTLSTSSFAQTRSKHFSYKDFVDKTENLEPGASIKEVKKIFGDPYKIAFIKVDNVVYKQYSYKTNSTSQQSTYITYNFIFEQGKLIALLEDENYYEGLQIYKNHLTLDLLKKEILE